MENKQMTDFLQRIKDRAEELENSISQSLANHNALIGALNEIRSMVNIFSEIAGTVMPSSPVTTVLKEASSVVDKVDNVLTSSSQDVDSPSAES
jgi:hypothetical protein